MSFEAENARLRPMHAADIKHAVALTQAEGWPHRAEDWAFHLRHGAGWVLEGAEGALLGTLLCWEYGRDVATLGLIVVDRRCQGRGLGSRLMQHAVDVLGGRTLRLVATEAGYSLYRRYGFEPVAPVRQCQGVSKDVTPVSPDPGDLLRPLAPEDLAQVCEIDANATGMDRSELLRDLCFEGEGLVLETSGQLVGVGIARPAGRGVVVGPLIAREQRQAQLLLSHLLAGRKDFCRIDVPGNATALVDWLQEVGLPVMDKVTAMQFGTMPSHETQAFNNFALVSQALG